MGKETIDQYNTSETRGRELSHGLNYQKLGKQLMTEDELAVMDGGKCILQLRGVRPFFSDKFDITKHPKYKYLSDADPKNAFDMEKHLKRRPPLSSPTRFLTITSLTRQTYRRTQTMRKRSAEEKQKQLERFLMNVAEAADAALWEYWREKEANTAVLQRSMSRAGGLSRNSDSMADRRGTGEATLPLRCLAAATPL